MPTNKHELLDWLMDVPDDAEIGTDGAGLALLAILGTNVHLLEIGHIPNADELYAEVTSTAPYANLPRAQNDESAPAIPYTMESLSRFFPSPQPLSPVVGQGADPGR